MNRFSPLLACWLSKAIETTFRDSFQPVQCTNLQRAVTRLVAIKMRNIRISKKTLTRHASGFNENAATFRFNEKVFERLQDKIQRNAHIFGGAAA